MKNRVLLENYYLLSDLEASIGAFVDADGYLRAAGERATARIAGHEVPLAGRVSMDLISLDVSALPASAVRPGTMVELISARTGGSCRRPGPRRALREVGGLLGA